MKKTVAAILIIFSVLLPSASFAEPNKNEKKPESLGEAARLHPEEMKLFEKLLQRIGDGCAKLWAQSENLRKRCVVTEMDNFNAALGAGELDNKEFLKNGKIIDRK